MTRRPKEVQQGSWGPQSLHPVHLHNSNKPGGKRLPASERQHTSSREQIHRGLLSSPRYTLTILTIIDTLTILMVQAAPEHSGEKTENVSQSPLLRHAEMLTEQ